MSVIGFTKKYPDHIVPHNQKKMLRDEKVKPVNYWLMSFAIFISLFLFNSLFIEQN